MNRILNIFRFLFSPYIYIPKNEKISDKAFSRTIISSVLGIFICGIFLASLTWAWFTSGVSSGTNNITAADFSVQTTYKNEQNEEINPFNADGTFKKGTYTVTLTSSGSASTGYCRVEFNENTYHTAQLFNNENGSNTITFKVYASDSDKLKITPQWGTYAKPDSEVLIGNDEENHKIYLGTPPEPETTTNYETVETQAENTQANNTQPENTIDQPAEDPASGTEASTQEETQNNTETNTN